MKKQRWLNRYVFRSAGITAYLMSILCLVFILSGCGSDNDSNTATFESPPELSANYADRAVLDWAGVDYSNDGFCDGLTDSDYDGPVDAYDAVMLIRTWQRLGLAVPATTMDGLYENHYTEYGYDFDLSEFSTPQPFPYTVAHPLGNDDIKAANTAQDWDLLTTDADHPLLKGDLIFFDFHYAGGTDLSWDNAAVYLGQYGDIAHAALLIYDYYDEGVVIDLENNIWFREDIDAGHSDIRRPDYDSINAYGETPDTTPPTAWFCHEGPNGGAYTVIITFSAGMTGFTQDDIIVENGSISALTSQHVLEAGTENEITVNSACVYKVTIDPTAAGDITVRIPAGAAIGSNGEANAEASYAFSQAIG